MTLTPAIMRMATRCPVVNGTAIVLALIATLANQRKSGWQSAPAVRAQIDTG